MMTTTTHSATLWRSVGLTMLVWSALAAAGAGAGGCLSGTPADGRLEVNVAALDLVGVGDVVWDLEVGAGDTVVWQRRVTSSRFGDGAGSASYLGSCDADAGTNTIRVWVVGLYPAPVSDAGSFGTGAATVAGNALDFVNPTSTSPLTREVTCSANEDTSVSFEVSLMRPAQQGFFDVALSFNHIFCAAKLDCCRPGVDGVCAIDGSEDLDLLFDGDGARNRTIVLGFACTAGLAADVNTTLYLDDLALDCDVNSAATTFAADVTIDPDDSAAPGNLCTPGALSACAAITEVGAADADSYLFQAAVFRGDESLAIAGATAHKVYWNVALGVTDAIAGCTLRTRATADDAATEDDGVSGGAITEGVVYPYVRWDVDLGTCAAEALTFNDPSAPVTPVYTQTNATSPTSFAHLFAPGLPVAPELCVAGQTDCALATCQDVLDSGRASVNGVYAIDPDGPDTGAAAFEVTCDLTSDGGGWTMIGRGAWMSHAGTVWRDDTLPSGYILTVPTMAAVLGAAGDLFRLGSGTAWFYVRDANPLFTTHYWRSDSASVQCATSYSSVSSGTMTTTATKAVSCDATAFGSHSCGSSNGWILLHLNDAFNISGAHPCSLGTGYYPTGSALIDLWVR